MQETLRSILVLIFTGVVTLAAAAEPAPDSPPLDTSVGDAQLRTYFAAQTRELETRCLADIESRDDWLANRGTYRAQLFEMLGLEPLPERIPLQAEVTGTVSHPEFEVERVHFQSLPGLYVTGNLYIPRERSGPLPTILYVCGHARVVRDGVSYGNKTAYQHHGAWFARNGYVCLMIDTVQLGEIPGLHHGTYREGMWWWNARGYTPAGVEAWNCIRALDYLETRPEVDATRFGVTGRSGGGAYSWWIAALDDRIQVAVPVAGITSLRNHVVDGCVEGHCDCMYPLNTFRWDFPLVAALVAPRPLLISNTDKDRIFPLDGVVDVYMKTRRIYRLLDAEQNIGLQITEGPHKDTQVLRIHAFDWFNRFLKRENPTPLIEMAAVKMFEPEELRVFEELPDDQRNSTIHETFVPKADSIPVPANAEQWQQQRDRWRMFLRERCFRGWPESDGPLQIETICDAEQDGIRLLGLEFTSQQEVRLPVFLMLASDKAPAQLDLIVLNALGQDGWSEFVSTLMAGGFGESLAGQRRNEALEPDAESWKQLRGMLTSFPWGMAYTAPRGIGPTVWDEDPRERVHIRRRFMLLGQTRDGMRVWDIRRAAQALRTLDNVADVPLWMQGEGEAAGQVLYAALFTPRIARVDLHELSPTHREGPIFLNVLRSLDVPQALAMLAERSKVRVYGGHPEVGSFVSRVAEANAWDASQFQVRDSAVPEAP